MKTVAVVNQKGGAGKTPTAVHLSFALARAGKKVLFIDFDSQATASLHFLGKKYREIELTIYDAVTKQQVIAPHQINDFYTFYLLTRNSQEQRMNYHEIQQ